MDGIVALVVEPRTDSAPVVPSDGKNIYLSF